MKIMRNFQTCRIVFSMTMQMIMRSMTMTLRQNTWTVNVMPLMKKRATMKDTHIMTSWILMMMMNRLSVIRMMTLSVGTARAAGVVKVKIVTIATEAEQVVLIK